MSKQEDNPQSRHGAVKELGLEYDVWGESPVQATGSIRGREFYFRAKDSMWTFEAANDLGALPSDVGGDAVFFVKSRHNNASFMPLAEASTIIEKCAQLFLEVTEQRLKVLGS